MSNYGNTGPLSPISSTTEDDMAKVKDIFQKALDSIIAATELSKQVKALASDVDKLRTDMEQAQARNVELDRMLHDTREQRDRAESELQTVKADYNQACHEKSYAQSEASQLSNRVNDLEAQLISVKRERDEYGLNAMSIQEALDKANDKLAQIHKTMGIEFKPFEVPKPEPTPVIAKVTEPPLDLIPEPHILDTPKRRVYYGEVGFDYNKPNQWDSTIGHAYQEI